MKTDFFWSRGVRRRAEEDRAQALIRIAEAARKGHVNPDEPKPEKKAIRPGRVQSRTGRVYVRDVTGSLQRQSPRVVRGKAAVKAAKRARQAVSM